MKKGSVARRCSCRNPEIGTACGVRCPKLSNRRHGAWTVVQELELREDGARRRFRRSGFATSAEAIELVDKVRALMAIPEREDTAGRFAMSSLLEERSRKGEPLPDYDETRRRFRVGEPLSSQTTVGEWLDEWIAGRKRLRPSGIKRYQLDIRVHLKPHLGKIRLDKLRVAHISAMFDAINKTNIEIEEQNNQGRAALEELKAVPWKGVEHRALRKQLKESIERMPRFCRVTGLTTQRNIRATLRASLNVAIAQQRMPAFNPAQHVELLPGTKPKALIWTEERVAHWQATGEKPSPVMVWTPEQTGRFLDHVEKDWLKVMWRLIAFRGLRRGEACAPRRMDHHYRSALLTVVTQLVQDGWQIIEGAPKTSSGTRVVS